MKMCSKCGVLKDETEFYNRSGKRKNEKMAWCKKCNNKITGEIVIEKRRNNKLKGIKIKGGKCKICGLKFNNDPYIFHFHHLDPLIKENNFRNITSFNTFLKEIDKCILVCGNCHREIHGNLYPKYLLKKVIKYDYQINKNTDKLRDLKQDFINYKGGKCLHCGYLKYDGALEFHHVNPNEKEFTIGYSFMKKSYLENLYELDKCIMLCCNCHARIHNEKRLEN